MIAKMGWLDGCERETFVEYVIYGEFICSGNLFCDVVWFDDEEWHDQFMNGIKKH